MQMGSVPDVPRMMMIENDMAGSGLLLSADVRITITDFAATVISLYLYKGNDPAGNFQNDQLARIKHLDIEGSRDVARAVRHSKLLAALAPY